MVTLETKGISVSRPAKEGRRKSVANIPLGGSREPVKPVLDALEVRGVKVHSTTVRRIRGGFTGGTMVGERAIAWEIIQQDDASKKNNLYTVIAQKGLDTRRPQKPPKSYKFNAVGFVEGIARDLNIRPQVIRRLMRAMRVDMVYAERHEPDADFSQKFKYIANDFIEAYTKKDDNSTTEKKRQIMEEIRDQWTGSIEDFYRLIYSRLNVAAIGTWPPYEVEAFLEFYSKQIASGNHLTAFDKLILQARNQGRATLDLAAEVRASTGILVDDHNIEMHRNALLYAKS